MLATGNQHNKIFLQGHRGDPLNYPENSIDGFINCAKNWIPAIELDVVISKDLEIIVLHDPKVNSKVLISDRKNEKIFGLNKDEIKSIDYNLGTFTEDIKFPKIPTLEELIHSISDHCNKKHLRTPVFTIELKSDSRFYQTLFPNPKVYAAIVNECLSKFDFLDYKIQSFDHQLLIEIQKISSSELIYLIYETPSLKDLREITSRLKLQGIGALHKIIHKKTVQEWQSMQLEISAWTVDEDEEMFRLIDLGITNIITNRSIEMAKLLRQKGYELY